MELLSILLAQGIAGGIDTAGWTSAGLVSSVLAWLLFKHLPKKDEQMENILKTKDAQLAKKDEQLASLLANKDLQITELTAAYRGQLEQSQAFFEKNINNICKSQKTDIEYLAKTLEREVSAMNDGTKLIAIELARIADDRPRRDDAQQPVRSGKDRVAT